jgi:putative ABC transport system permease protein
LFLNLNREKTMTNLIQDLRFGLKLMLKSPTATAIVVLTLALGIGANTTIFSIVDAILLRPLLYKDSERLVMVWATYPQLQMSLDRVPVSAGDFIEWRDQNTVFEQISAIDSTNLTLIGIGEPERIVGASVSANFFELMGVSPSKGRLFTHEEDQPGKNNVLVISDGLWKRRFGADPEIIGQALTLNDKSYTVIGIMPAGFQFPRAGEMPAYFEFPPQAELWLPIAISPKRISSRRNHDMAVIARLKPGVSLEQAQTEISGISARLEDQYPENKGWGALVMSLRSHLVGDIQTALLVLLGAVGFVLLIVCANVANILLAQSAARQQEISIRVALGASRLRIIQQLLTESLLIALAGGILGILLALSGIELFLRMRPDNIPRSDDLALNGWSLIFTLGVSILTGIVFGLAPIYHSSKLNFSEALKQGAKSVAGSVSRRRVRSLLVVSEVALALILLTGAGLLINSFTRLLNVSPGFNPRNVLTMDISLPASRYPDKQKQTAFYQQALEKMKALPGVRSAGLVLFLPLRGAAGLDEFVIEGRPIPPDGEKPITEIRIASPDYFTTMEIPLLSGRALTEQDKADGMPVVVINETMARRFWSNESPIGSRVKTGGKEPQHNWEGIWLTIVGVVADVKGSLDSETRPQMYFSYLQHSFPAMSIAVRTSTDTTNLSAAVRQAVQEVDKDQPVTNVNTMEKYLAESVAQRRFNTVVLGIFAAIALILAAVGIYGVMAYSVIQRTHEIGVRMALGAQKTDIIKLILRHGTALVLAGVVIGLAAAYALTRVISKMLYGVSATDPVTFGFVTLLLVGVAILASLVPALRATKVDPLVALRQE